MFLLNVTQFFGHIKSLGVFSLFSDDIADGRITLILKKLEATVEEDGCLQQLL